MTGPTPANLPEKSDAAKREEETLKFWQENKIFEKSLKLREGKEEFVFYDGPPFATGLPHHGTLLSSVAKDVIPRYKTMRGFYVRRRWGWDTHGLPIENMIEKDLGLKSKKDILALGIEQFNEACRAKVMQYAHDWQKYVDRVGRWVEFESAYKTMDATYTESVWWALKQMHEKGLLYEGRKVLMYCPHCETPLAKAEIAMDNSYKDVTEEAVTVKFRLKIENWKLKIADTPTYLLAWTTTPWTLPANVALAVGPEIEYSLVTHPDSVSPSLINKRGVGVSYIVASALVEKHFGKDAKVEKTFFGKDLEGIEYEPLFQIPAVQQSGKPAYYVALADFVSTEEGTGIVHTAVIYGEDDYQLGLKNDLPMVPILNSNGTYNDLVPEFLQGQYIKKADKLVIEDLEKRGLLFSKAPNTHSYPHCYRCGTALIYNALSSWFVNIQKIKARMIELNEKINWVPEHLKHGRFLNIVENAPDWTISRNRFWASPLPIWKCSECDLVKVVGSLSDLEDNRSTKPNKYILVRHGQSEKNSGNGEQGVIATTREGDRYHLTEEGREQSRKIASELKSQNIDLIVTSPYLRTKETAEAIGSLLGVKVEEDERLKELQLGQTLEGKTWDAFREFEGKRGFDDHLGEGESCREMLERMRAVVVDLDKKYQGKSIVLVSHGDPLWLLRSYLMNLSPQETLKQHDSLYPKRGEFYVLSHSNYPRNKNMELDFHRPYIDAIKLACSCGGEMVRIPEVVDCWVESGSMPFAEYHYPTENKKEFEGRFPGDYIAEYISQTRTWFYYMLAVSTALFDREPFKNVVTTGNLLAADGAKISKSKGNYTDPLLLIDKYGADAYRYYEMVSVVMQGEDALFKDDEVKEVYQRMINILWNVVQFYTTYKIEGQSAKVKNQNYTSKFENVLDRWILARLAELNRDVTENLDKFDTVKAGRPIRDFVTDLSTWYIRRSRDRFKSDNAQDRDSAIGTTRFVLLELSKLIAPFMPFLAEQVYKAVGGELESVHLENWTEIKSEPEHSDVLENTRITRDIVSLALEARQKEGIKVRQPLASLQTSAKLAPEYLELIKDEVNVKEVKFGPELLLDTNITPELELEGKMRDLVRSVQEKRKDLGLQPTDQVNLTLPTSLGDLIPKFESEIKKSVHAQNVSLADTQEIKIEKV
ncbi:MAG TPA: class I tRNA ligase family protein [Candidatus Paceibacterota bacterium]